MYQCAKNELDEKLQRKFGADKRFVASINARSSDRVQYKIHYTSNTV